MVDVDELERLEQKLKKAEQALARKRSEVTRLRAGIDQARRMGAHARSWKATFRRAAFTIGSAVALSLAFHVLSGLLLRH